MGFFTRDIKTIDDLFVHGLERLLAGVPLQSADRAKSMSMAHHNYLSGSP